MAQCDQAWAARDKIRPRQAHQLIRQLLQTKIWVSIRSMPSTESVSAQLNHPQKTKLQMQPISIDKWLLIKDTKKTKSIVGALTFKMTWWWSRLVCSAAQPSCLLQAKLWQLPHMDSNISNAYRIWVSSWTKMIKITSKGLFKDIPWCQYLMNSPKSHSGLAKKTCKLSHQRICNLNQCQLSPQMTWDKQAHQKKARHKTQARVDLRTN